ncbi:isoprenyl transferase [Paenibacillus psychroresistens]|uniref:Isoprenyl transferase n=1 Tax=Paenibacillus psychroresistens TaxID=1778678 RepID=A0A6B8RL39_9BACL|nr:isoprenyl transferase [Paenibacillus psychroresistens]QGQ96263.1 isoprenyl transferase [Paenibacillus psychroresistens]
MMDWIKGLGKKKSVSLQSEISVHKVPHHVAIIMDGNGRWAKKRGLPRIAGHHSGMKAVKRITIAADEIGVKILTLYAFSTENWSRPRDEVDYLMKLPQQFLLLELNELIEKNVQVRVIGWREGLPEYTLEALDEAVDRTKNNTGLILNFALNYGSRKEMLEGMKRVTVDIQAGKVHLEQLDEEMFSSYLQTDELPDPDLLIRTSGEQRLSNFMLWQLAYTELYFTACYWPDFSKEHFFEAIEQYQQRIRRYGGL